MPCDPLNYGHTAFLLTKSHAMNYDSGINHIPPLLEMGMPEDNKNLVLPGWWVKIMTIVLPVVATLLVTLFIAAVPWAWSLQSDVSSIKAGLEFQRQLHTQTIIEQTRRIEDHEQRLRTIERKP